ncbi:hypothetical protein Hanom_Chr07g00650791 [Helianthus anomalus]
MIHSFASLKTGRRVIFLAVVCFAMLTKVITSEAFKLTQLMIICLLIADAFLLLSGL